MDTLRRKRGMKLYFSSLLIYGLGLLICIYLPYYQKTLNPEVLQILSFLYLSYAVFAPIMYYFRITPYTENKPYLFLRWLGNLLRKGKLKFEPEEKTAALFLLVKIFFLPLMIKFFLSNYHYLQNTSQGFFTYPVLLTFIFALDTLVFAIGYAVEFRSLKNVVKSVEPTFFGWLVAIICYPPFNGWIGDYIPWGANDQVIFWSISSTIILRITIIILFVIYVLATLALGLKASNLTNRGIVTRFPYSIIRHPAYISKNLVWWITLLPVISWPLALGLLFWTVIYFFRAITEERHLSDDPDYLEYKKKVRWKFIPGIF